MTDENLYPPENPKARRRGVRKARPKHLPPYRPPAEAPHPHAEALARKQAAAPAPAPSFGAKAGASNALLFHALQKKATLSPGHDHDDDHHDDDGP